MHMRRRLLRSVTPTKIAIAFAVIATLAAMVASARNAITLGRTQEVNVHVFAMMVMLFSYLCLILVIIVCRKKPLTALSVVDKKEMLAVSPCIRNDVIVLDQDAIDQGRHGPIFDLPRASLYNMRIAIARSVTVPEGFSETLRAFPNLVVLDLQGSTVPVSFWTSVESLESIEHVLAYECMELASLKHLSISLPEVKFWMEPRKLAIGSTAAMNSLDLSGTESE